MVTFTKRRLVADDSVLVASLGEDGDLVTVRDAADELVRAVPTHVTSVILDLSETSNLDSRGVHILLEVVDHLRLRQLTVYLVAPEPSAIRHLLTIVGITDILPVATSVEEALKQIGKSSYLSERRRGEAIH